MDDSFKKLEDIFKEEMKEIKGKTYDELVEICKQENLEYDDLSEDELRDLLIEYFSDEIEE